tara:strand:- start:146 stop:313 length:168 start_codon:yes stop_codon:yes gene_type:complete
MTQYKNDDKTTFVIRDIPVDTWTKFKIQGLEKGKTINEMLLGMIEEKVDGYKRAS